MSLTKVTNSMILGAPFNVLDYGADPTNTTDSTTAFTNALAAAAAATNGASVYVPAGTYNLTAALTVPKKTIFFGDGRETSILKFTHTGNGLENIAALNSSVDITNCVRDMYIWNTNASNTGAGYDNVGGTFLEIKNVRIEGFKYNVILDQSELVQIKSCQFESPLSASVWMVNGPDHTFTTSVAAAGLGVQTVTPVSMAIITKSFLANGALNTYMWAENADKTNGEVIQINSITETTFTTSFTTTKSANFVIGARPGFTNQIEISGCQFNGTTLISFIIDDGGGPRYIAYNNFNAGSVQYRAASVGGLGFYNNSFEGASSQLIYLGSIGSTGRNNGFTFGFTILSNTFVGAIVQNYLDQCQNGIIKGNVYIQYSLCGISLDNPNFAIDVEITNNNIVTYGQGITLLPLFLDSQLTTVVAQGNVKQGAQTNVPLALAATGVQTITPSTMQFITVGKNLQCRNVDGSNLEVVTVTAVAATTFTATFASTKTAKFLVNAYTGV